MGDKNKNAYEIRESLLGMAVGILSDRDSRLRENEYLKPEGTRNPIEGYGVDEVIEIAKKLDSFVSQT